MRLDDYIDTNLIGFLDPVIAKTKRADWGGLNVIGTCGGEAPCKTYPSAVEYKSICPASADMYGCFKGPSYFCPDWEPKE